MAAKLLKILKIPLFKVLTCAKSVHFTYSFIITHSKSAYLHLRLHVWGACGRQFESAHPDTSI